MRDMHKKKNEKAQGTGTVKDSADVDDCLQQVCKVQRIIDRNVPRCKAQQQKPSHGRRTWSGDGRQRAKKLMNIHLERQKGITKTVQMYLKN